MACENDTIQLVCNPYSRIAVYSASFGRTSYESIQCSQPQGVMEECKYFCYCLCSEWSLFHRIGSSTLLSTLIHSFIYLFACLFICSLYTNSVLKLKSVINKMKYSGRPERLIEIRGRCQM